MSNKTFSMWKCTFFMTCRAEENDHFCFLQSFSLLKKEKKIRQIDFGTVVNERTCLS